MTTDELRTILQALQWARDEIHNPGAGNHYGHDVLDKLEHAHKIVKRYAVNVVKEAIA